MELRIQLPIGAGNSAVSRAEIGKNASTIKAWVFIIEEATGSHRNEGEGTKYEWNTGRRIP